MQNYVAGLAFTEDRKQVLLIAKQKPAWQAGHWNAIGGKLENGETSLEAMHREFKEETGLEDLNWEFLGAVYKLEVFCVKFYYTFDDKVFQAKTMEEEVVNLLQVSFIFNEQIKVIRNLPLMVSLALDVSGIKKPVWFFEEEGEYNPPKKRLQDLTEEEIRAIMLDAPRRM